MNITCQEKMVEGETFADRARAVAEAGFAGIDLMGQGLESRVEEVKRVVAETSLKTPAVYSQLGKDGRLLDQSSSARARVFKTLQERVTTTADVGADFLVFVPKPSKGVRDEAREGLLVAILDELVAWARDVPVTVVLEPLNKQETDLITDPRVAASMVRLVDSPRLKTMVDTYHMELEGQDMPGLIRELHPDLGLVHLSDTNRTLPGEGNVNFREVLRALKEIGFAGPLGLEGGGPYPAERLKRCVDYLKGLWADV